MNKNTPTRITQNDDLHGTGNGSTSLIEQSLRSLSDNDKQALMKKAGEEALRLEAKQREQNLDYVVGKKTAEDHIDTFNLLNKSGRTTRQKVTSDIKTGAGNMRIESKSGATCFVASVAYQDPNHPDVMFLRYFRDTVLQNSINGQKFISWYWINGPKMAKITEAIPLLRKISRFLISFLVKILRKTKLT